MQRKKVKVAEYNLQEKALIMVNKHKTLIEQRDMLREDFLSKVAEHDLHQRIKTTNENISQLRKMVAARKIEKEQIEEKLELAEAALQLMYDNISKSNSSEN